MLKFYIYLRVTPIEISGTYIWEQVWAVNLSSNLSGHNNILWLVIIQNENSHGGQHGFWLRSGLIQSE